MKAHKPKNSRQIFSPANALLLFIILGIASEILARKSELQARNSISGVVFGFQRQPVGETDVELQDELSRIVARTRTSSSGRYVFNNLRAGRYQIHVLSLATDYEEQTQEYEIINFTSQTSSGATRTSGSDYAQVDFYLKPRRSNRSDVKAPGTIFVQEIPGEAKKLYEKAVAALDRSSRDKALVYFKEALGVFPDYYLALEQLGIEYFRLKQYENAQDMLKKAITINPRAYVSWYELAQTQFALKNFEEATQAATKATELEPTAINALLILSVSLKENGRYNDAEAKLKKADKVGKGKIAEIHWQLAKLYADKLKQFQKAADELELFLKLDPENPNAMNIKKLIASFRERSKNKIQ